MDKKNRIMELGIYLVILLVMSIVAFSANSPEGPTTLDVVTSSSRTPTSSVSISSVGGNLSQLDVFAYSQTMTWAGYYGNVSGTIVLGDAAGNVIYDWYNANPSGQIYATTNIDADFDNIACYNFSKSGGGYLDLSTYESSLGLNENSADGINETFNESTNYNPFYVSITYINDICPVAYLYNSSNQSSVNTYQEVMLYDNTNNDIIYTSIIRPGGITGFNGLKWDFQMIVAEDGHNGNDEPTTYYFYVALE